MEISLPFGILKKLWNWLTKKLFLSSYQTSHEAYWKAKRLGKIFHKLGDSFEYDTYLPFKYLSNLEIPVPSIIIRNKSNTKFKRAELIFEAYGINIYILTQSLY